MTNQKPANNNKKPDTTEYAKRGQEPAHNQKKK